ncbi:hypothetical protein RHGRI_000822 [Rhododendron griersonianum]|uniref:DUF4378 domain-containing protein n=1 Tax=Rhododendron griersonianum TaxID=479676 RepID=A0AAV6LLH0_9ERIC|nr:hypothetical protein RHGRI_000822 [Rhododendron griersonianum]
MPQDRLRSFVKCDDPKGVVECGTIRKSKSNPNRLEEKAESRKMPKNSNSSSSSAYKEAGKEMVPEKDTEDNPSSFQLLEVSKGAQKLNQVIDSWSKGMNFDGNSKEIAKDLLKGALDLQESLIMLGKLQEASQYMAKLKKKQKERSKGEKVDQVGMERTKSLCFTERNYDLEFQKPRFSDYGCSRDFFEQREKSMGERVYERTNSHRFLDHNHETGFQKLRVSDYGYSSDCFKQKEKSTGERIHEMEIERMDSHHFIDRSYQKGFHKPKRSVDEKSGGERIHEVGIERTNSHYFMDHNCQTGFQKPRLSADELSRGEFFHDVGIKRSNSHHIGDRNDQTVLQMPRLSADGYSRECFGELRTVIRDSLARQNLLPPSCIEERDFCQKRAPDSAPGIASTSSSQSSMGNSHEFASSNSSLSSKAPNKPKGSNLIAKLMGIEEFPRKWLEHEKISSPRRAVFDTDMPKARKPQSAAYKVDTEQVKLKEIVETMHFKGLLKSNAAEGLGLQYRHSNVSDSKKRFSEDAPPIVIMRPWRISSAEEREPRVQKLIREIEALDMSDSQGGLNSVEICGRVKKGDETPTKRISQEGDKGSKVVRAKPEEISVKTKGKLSSNKSNPSVAVNQQQRKREIEKRVDKVQKVAPCRKKPEEVENVKSKGAIKWQDEAKVTSPKERRPEVGSIIAKSRVSQQKYTSSSVISKHAKPAVPQNIGDQKKNRNNERPVKAPLAADFVIIAHTVENESVGCKYGDKLMDICCENEADTTIIYPAAANQLLTNEGTDASEIQIDEQCDSSQNFPYDILLQTTQHESFNESAEETKHCISQKVTETICFRTETNAEDLILSSPSFLSYAEELYDINSNNAIHLKPISLNNHETNERRLLLDCANELMQYRILRCKQPVHPLLLIPVSCSKSTTSLSQLAEEVSDGIENLRSYRKNFGEKFHKDSLFSVVERDLRYRGVVSGGWDLGWKHSFTADEVEEAVGDVEKLVFSELLEDMFVDFIL